MYSALSVDGNACNPVDSREWRLSFSVVFHASRTYIIMTYTYEYTIINTLNTYGVGYNFAAENVTSQ